jgi:L-seryl-tRNA(Ser) seleniumtransferase
MSELRQLPSVDQLASMEAMTDIISRYNRPLTIDAIRFVLDTIRSNFKPGDGIPTEPDLISKIENQLDTWTAMTLQNVINATGVIIHTNLGRAPLSIAALNAVKDTAP